MKLWVIDRLARNSLRIDESPTHRMPVLLKAPALQRCRQGYRRALKDLLRAVDRTEANHRSSLCVQALQAALDHPLTRGAFEKVVTDMSGLGNYRWT